MNLPKNAIEIEIANSTVTFYKYLKDGLTYLYFDTSTYAAPEPMINAMAGLKALKDENYRLIMINHTLPLGLFPRIENDFQFEFQEFENYKLIEFKLKTNSPKSTDFNDNQCSG